MNLWTIPLRICASALWLNFIKVSSFTIDAWAPEYARTWMQANNLAALAFGALAIWCWGRK